MILIPVTGGPSWADIMTAFGTVGAVVAALGIALWAEWRSGRRLKAEHERSDRLLAEERENSRAQIEEERRLIREREQLAEAYAVQIIAAVRIVKGSSEEIIGRGRQLAVIVVNRGMYTISAIEVQFCLDGKQRLSALSHQRLSGFESVPESLRGGFSDVDIFTPGGATPMYGVLAPWDVGVRFQTDTLDVELLKGPYPLVRWTDRWGTRWEHSRGKIDQVPNGDKWILKLLPVVKKSWPFD